MISPTWLQAQGINPALVEIQGFSPKRVSWAGGSGVAHRAFVFGASLSGYELPMNEFLLMETDLFAPPETHASCCDGVLGTDFLRLFAVEFSPGPPAEIRLWPREHFHGVGEAISWVEASQTPAGDVVSACRLAKPEAPLGGITSVRWDTGNEEAIEVHEPWRPEVAKLKGAPALACGPDVIASAAPTGEGDYRREEDIDYLKTEVPGATVGMSLLGRGAFALDLSHGRIWFPPKILAEPVRTNRSGLRVEFFLNRKGDRELRVTGVRAAGPVARLFRLGLQPGAQITEMDSRPAALLDTWEVNQRLAGVYGEKVKLRWKGKTGGTGVAELKLR
jgi:hypothetical protein